MNYAKQSTKKRPEGRFLALYIVLLYRCTLLNPTLLDTSFLTGTSTQVIELAATNLTVFVHCDFLNERAVHREDTLNAHVARHFADSETLLVLRTVNADYIATELLDTLFVTLFNTISYGNLVTGFECRKLFLFTGECLFSNLNQIHCYSLFMD